MGFKADSDFLRFLTIGAAGVRSVIDELRSQGFEPIELERYCTSNKIWSTKVKRLRLPDLVCVRTGLRIEVRAKSDLKIRMSHSPDNADRSWDAGLRPQDLVAFIASWHDGDKVQTAPSATYFTVDSMLRSVGTARLGAPKSASEGSERDVTWPSWVPSRDGIIKEIRPDAIDVTYFADGERPDRSYTYRSSGKTPYISAGDRFVGGQSIAAGTPEALADPKHYLSNRYDPLTDLRSAGVLDRYAATKVLPYSDVTSSRGVEKLEALISLEDEPRVILEACGSAALMGSNIAVEKIQGFIWKNDERPDLRIEALLILSEHEGASHAAEILESVAADKTFLGDEARQVAVWGLGSKGLKAYSRLLNFIADEDDDVALHAIAGFGRNTPRAVIDDIVSCLVGPDPRRSAAASAALQVIGSTEVFRALRDVARQSEQIPDWLLATIGRLPREAGQDMLMGQELIDRLRPLYLMTAQGNWLETDDARRDMSILRKQVY